MQVRILAHFPYSAPEPLVAHMEELDPSEPVSSFKSRYAERLGVADPAAISVIYSGRVLADGDVLVESGEFEANAPNDRCYLHLRVRDLEVEARVQARLAAGESLIIPNSEVKPRETPVEAAH